MTAHPSLTPVPLGISDALLDVIRSAVRLRSKPADWRDSVYAMEKSKAVQSLVEIERAVEAKTTPRLSIFDWGIILSEIARYYGARRGAQRDAALAAFTALRTALHSAPEAKDAFMLLAAEEAKAEEVRQAELAVRAAQARLERAQVALDPPKQLPDEIDVDDP